MFYVWVCVFKGKDQQFDKCGYLHTFYVKIIFNSLTTNGTYMCHIKKKVKQQIYRATNKTTNISPA